MASPVKRRVVRSGVDDTENSDNEGCSDYEGEDYSGQQIVEVEFEGRTPVDPDFNGILTLLKQLFLKANVDLTDLTNLIIDQDDLGSVIKQSISDDEEDWEDNTFDDDNNVFGVTTIVNFTEFKDRSCVKQLQTLLQELCTEHGDEACKALVNSLLVSNGRSLGLLLNERFVNISARIVGPLLDTLRAELLKKKTKNKDYSIDYYVMICKLYKVAGGKNTKAKKAKKNNVNTTKKNQETSIIWSNPEEELFDEEADCKFEFCVEADVDSGLGGQWMEGDETLTPYRRVLFFSADKFEDLILRTMAMTISLT